MPNSLIRTDLSKRVWILRVKFSPRGKLDPIVNIDYLESDFSETDLWRLRESYKYSERRLIYKMRGSRWESLESYDFYPVSDSVPVVSDRMKDAVLQLCGPKQVAFHHCEIQNSRGETRIAWNLYPLNHIWCVDRTKTVAKWFIPNLAPSEASIDYTEHLVLNPDCMENLHILRLREFMSAILVSDDLKTVIENVNANGIDFIEPEKAVLGGFKPLDWDQIIAKH